MGNLVKYPEFKLPEGLFVAVTCTASSERVSKRVSVRKTKTAGLPPANTQNSGFVEFRKREKFIQH